MIPNGNGRHIRADAKRFEDWTRILHDQALLAEGGELEDTGGFVTRLNSLLFELMK